jgi:dolichol-phosphate mannosyltransferase
MGIGLEVARTLAAQGDELILVARGADALREAVDSLPGTGHRFHAFDVSDEAAWSEVQLDELGGLVCAAAVMSPIGPIGDYSLREFKRTLEINLLGTLYAIHHCLTALRRGGGSIVTFGGGGATGPLPRFDAYATSKAGVARLTENLSPVLAPLAINCVAPGFVVTRLHEQTLAAGAEAAGAEFYERTRRTVAEGGFPASEASELVSLLLGGVPFTGKLISAQWDDWRSPDFGRRLASDPALATVRRVDGAPSSAGPVTRAAMAPPPELSIVVPAYNEEPNIERIYTRLRDVVDGIGLRWELIFSVDPSTDRTEELIAELHERDPRVKLLRFSRRFGQPMATEAGLAAATGDAVVVIDCDLQDPPELIGELVARWRDGFDVVYAQRRSREGETLAKRIVSAVGYRVIARIADVEIPPNTGDFRLMSRRVVDHVVALKESHGFLRGLVGLVGFRQTSVLYDRDARAGGSGKYNRFLGSLVIGLNGVFGFSVYPLRLISAGGILISGLAFLLAIVYFFMKLAGVPFPVGNPTIVILVAFFSGVQLFSLGVIGEYIGRIYNEVRDRPKYIVESRLGFDDQS